MTFIQHTGDTTVLDYIFMTMVESDDIEGVIPIDTDDDSVVLLLLGTNYTGRVQFADGGLLSLQLNSKAKDEELYNAAHNAYEMLAVHYGITLRESTAGFSIVIQPIKHDS